MRKPNKQRRFIYFFTGVLLGLIGLSALGGFLYISTFTRASGLSVGEIIRIISHVNVQRGKFKQNRTHTFLVLGLDKRADDLEQTLLTDTIMLASLNIEKNSFTIIPLPRDLWIPELKTKINALYFYGEEKGAGQGASYAMNEIRRITDASIDYFIVLDYADLPLLIDTVGAIKVAVAESFEDNQYPNPDFIKGLSNDPYMTVRFEKGTTYLNGKQTLRYVRSRHNEGVEGSDSARTKRQMQVLQAIVNSVKDYRMLLKPATLGRLFRFWDQHIQKNLTNEDLLAFFFSVQSSQLSLRFVMLPTQYTDTIQPILANPPVSKYKLWVWEPVDPSWATLRKFVRESFQQ